MKDKIIFLIIGFLVGAIVSTGAFYIYNTTVGRCDCSNQMNGGQPPEMPSGENGQPREKPDGENGQPPEKPSDSNNQNNAQENN